jgi:hypothetical protein
VNIVENRGNNIGQSFKKYLRQKYLSKNMKFLEKFQLFMLKNNHIIGIKNR